MADGEEWTDHPRLSLDEETQRRTIRRGGVERGRIDRGPISWEHTGTFSTREERTLTIVGGDRFGGCPCVKIVS